MLNSTSPLQDLITQYNKLHYRVQELGEVASLVDILELNSWNNVEKSTETLDLQQELIKDNHTLRLIDEMSTGLESFLHRKLTSLLERSEGPAVAGSSELRDALKTLTKTVTLVSRYLDKNRPDPTKLAEVQLPGLNHLKRVVRELTDGSAHLLKVSPGDDPAKFVESLRSQHQNIFESGTIKFSREGLEVVPFTTIPDPANVEQWLSPLSHYELRKTVEEMATAMQLLSARQLQHDVGFHQALSTKDGTDAAMLGLLQRLGNLYIQQGIITMKVISTTLSAILED